MVAREVVMQGKILSGTAMDLASNIKTHRFRPIARGAVRSTGRLATAWLAVFCLYVQLAASVVCLSGAPLGAVSVDASRAPICHTPAGGEAGTAHHGDLPGHDLPDHGSCPFCALHCHGAIPGFVASIAVPTQSSFVRPRIAPPRTVARALPRLIAGVSPRGPPAA